MMKERSDNKFSLEIFSINIFTKFLKKSVFLFLIDHKGKGSDLVSL